MSSPTGRVGVVLDTSAITQFCQGSTAVGELIAEIDDEAGVTGLPVLCLAEASRCVADPARLMLLVGHHATVLLDLPAVEWRALAKSTDDVVGRADATSAVLAAIRYDCHVLTAAPALYAGLDDGGPILSIED